MVSYYTYSVTYPPPFQKQHYVDGDNCRKRQARTPREAQRQTNRERDWDSDRQKAKSERARERELAGFVAKCETGHWPDPSPIISERERERETKQDTAGKPTRMRAKNKPERNPMRESNMHNIYIYIYICVCVCVCVCCTSLPMRLHLCDVSSVLLAVFLCHSVTGY